MSGDRGDCAESGDDFESADEAEWILSVDSRGSGRILCFEQSVELIGGLGAEVVPQDRIGRNSRKTRSFEECLDPEMRAAADERSLAASADIGECVIGILEEIRDIVRFVRFGDIDEVVADAAGDIFIICRRFRIPEHLTSADIHAAVHLAAIGRDDFAVQPVRQLDG